MKLKGLVVGALCALMSVGAFANKASDDLRAQLNKFTTYSAQFTQTTYNANHQIVQSTSGLVFMKRPNQFRWQIMKPNQQLIVASGRLMWVYDEGLRQVTKEKINYRSGRNPAALLTGHVSELLDHFRVSEITQPDSAIWFQLTPYDHSRVAYKLVQLQFMSGRLTNVRLDDKMNQTTVYTFTQVRLNKSLDPSLFTFTPPPGVTVTDNTK